MQEVSTEQAQYNKEINVPFHILVGARNYHSDKFSDFVLIFYIEEIKKAFLLNQTLPALFLGLL